MFHKDAHVTTSTGVSLGGWLRRGWRKRMAGAWGEYKNSRTKRRLQPFPLGVVEAETFRRSTTLVIGPAIKSVDGAFVGVTSHFRATLRPAQGPPQPHELF
jgi:hypothetical protein